MRKLLFTLFVVILSCVAFAQNDVVVLKDSVRIDNEKTNVTVAVPVNETGLRFWYSASNAIVEGVENKDVQEVIIPSKILYNGKVYDVNKIAVEAFWGCKRLKTIEIPNSVTKIGWSAFRGCTSLTIIAIPESVTSIGEEVFFGCSSLANIVIPNSVIDIERYAFRGCTSLTNLEIPKSVETIDWRAFEDCINLKTVRVPKGLDISKAFFTSTCKIDWY